MNVRQIRRDVTSRGLQGLVDLGGIDLVVLVDDPISQARAGSDRLSEIVGEDAQPLKLEEGLMRLILRTIR
jgi:hypothetical protein